MRWAGEVGFLLFNGKFNCGLIVTGNHDTHTSQWPSLGLLQAMEQALFVHSCCSIIIIVDRVRVAHFFGTRSLLFHVSASYELGAKAEVLLLGKLYVLGQSVEGRLKDAEPEFQWTSTVRLEKRWIGFSLLLTFK